MNFFMVMVEVSARDTADELHGSRRCSGIDSSGGDVEAISGIIVD